MFPANNRHLKLFVIMVRKYLNMCLFLSYFCCCCYSAPIRWNRRFDINHYCSNCGCYIGRHITLSWYKRQLFLMRRNDLAESENRWQNFRRIEIEEISKSQKPIQVKPKKSRERTQTTSF